MVPVVPYWCLIKGIFVSCLCLVFENILIVIHSCNFYLVFVLVEAQYATIVASG
jgi:hypothetical protein